jgi:hypothetical protein
VVCEEGEVRAVVERYVAVRDEICAGRGTWMVHVFEDVKDSGLRFPAEMGRPPERPNHDFSRA